MEAATALDIGWLEILSSLGFTGLAIYLIAVVLPKIIGGFREELAGERSARKEATEQFLSASEAERVFFRESLRQVVAGFERQMDQHREGTREIVDRFANALDSRKERDDG